MLNKSKKTLNLSNYSALIIFVLLFLFTSIFYKDFLKRDFIINLLSQNTMIGFLSIGMTFVILTGNIDLSVGSVMALCGVVAAKLSPYPIIVPIVGALLVGIVAGALNGFLVSKMKIVPFMATLATMLGLRGLIRLITNNKSIPTPDRSDLFSQIANGEIIKGIPNLIIFLIITVIICAILLKWTTLGRHIYATGGNINAAKMMGIKTDRVQFSVYVISGIMAAIAAILMTSRLGSGQYNAGDGWETDAIAATVIGGTLMCGGTGNIVGTYFGALILGIIKQIFNLQGNLNTWWQNIATGVILITVVIIQSRTQKIKSQGTEK